MPLLKDDHYTSKDYWSLPEGERAELIDGKFPDIDRVIPKQTAPAEQIRFNVKYLADIEKCAKLFNPKWQSVVFELNGNTNAAVATVKSPTGETAKIIVMPMRVE